MCRQLSMMSCTFHFGKTAVSGAQLMNNLNQGPNFKNLKYSCY